jgi:hypothetical protein
MSTSTLTNTSIGRPITKFGISIYPVYKWGNGDNDLTVIRPNELVKIREMESPTVPTLVVENNNAVPVVLFAGETLEGGRQQRVLNQTVVLPPMSVTEIPVSCVEQGRWHGAQEFGGVGRMSPSKVRQSAMRGRQHEVWNEVEFLLDSRSVRSGTKALKDFFGDIDIEADAKRREKIAKVASWGPLAGQTGIVVTQGNQIQSVDLFGSQQFLEAMWPKMIESALGSVAPTSATTSRRDSGDRVLKFLSRLGKTMNESPRSLSTGQGEHVRIENAAMSGQALLLNGTLVHASAFPSAI